MDNYTITLIILWLIPGILIAATFITYFKFNDPTYNILTNPSVYFMAMSMLFQGPFSIIILFILKYAGKWNVAKYGIWGWGGDKPYHYKSFAIKHGNEILTYTHDNYSAHQQKAAYQQKGYSAYIVPTRVNHI